MEAQVTEERQTGFITKNVHFYEMPSFSAVGAWSKIGNGFLVGE